MDAETVDMIITSPPYHNLRVYSNDPCDLSNCESYEEYYYLLSLVIAECERILKPGGKKLSEEIEKKYFSGEELGFNDLMNLDSLYKSNFEKFSKKDDDDE